MASCKKRRSLGEIPNEMSGNKSSAVWAGCGSQETTANNANNVRNTISINLKLLANVGKGEKILYKKQKIRLYICVHIREVQKFRRSILFQSLCISDQIKYIYILNPIKDY